MQFHVIALRGRCSLVQAVIPMFFQTDISSSVAIRPEGRELLPTNVRPLHYNLTLEPDLEKFTFDGEVTIE